LIYGGRGISQNFSIISRNSIHQKLNSTILHFSEISLIVAVNQKSKTTFFHGFNFFQGYIRQSQVLLFICLWRKISTKPSLTPPSQGGE
jgi:hypothetical protein